MHVEAAMATNTHGESNYRVAIKVAVVMCDKVGHVCPEVLFSRACLRYSCFHTHSDL